MDLCIGTDTANQRQMAVSGLSRPYCHQDYSRKTRQGPAIHLADRARRRDARGSIRNRRFTVGAAFVVGSEACTRDTPLPRWFRASATFETAAARAATAPAPGRRDASGRRRRPRAAPVKPLCACMGVWRTRRDRLTSHAQRDCAVGSQPARRGRRAGGRRRARYHRRVSSEGVTPAASTWVGALGL